MLSQLILWLVQGFVGRGIAFFFFLPVSPHRPVFVGVKRPQIFFCNWTFVVLL